MTQRAATQRHLETVIALSKPGHVLATDAPTATIRNPVWFTRTGPNSVVPTPQRAILHRQLLDQLLLAAPDVGAERKAIVLAGPPGAGKGTILREVLKARNSRYLTIDADEFKKMLLAQALADGSFESFIQPPAIKELEATGEQFYPLELAALVHEESSILAALARNEALDEGTNIVIDTVLSSQPSAIHLGNILEDKGYSVEIIDVEVPFELSKARIIQRWHESYERALEGADPLGGRWVPSEYARSVFDGPDGKSKPEVAALSLAYNCAAVMRYRRYRTLQDTPGTKPNINAWEAHLVRSQPGAALLPVIQSRLPGINDPVNLNHKITKVSQPRRPPLPDQGRKRTQ